MQHYRMGNQITFHLDHVTRRLLEELAERYCNSKAGVARLAVRSLPDALTPEQVVEIRKLHYTRGFKRLGDKITWNLDDDTLRKVTTLQRDVPRSALIRWAVRELARANDIAFQELSPAAVAGAS